jgi:urease accessory protein
LKSILACATGPRPARLALRFDATAGRTRLRVDEQQSPWKVIRAFEQENGAALVHLHNVSGGILAGDHLSLDIEVGRGASAQITTTGATRLYRHREGCADSWQHTTILIGDGALLEYLPDSVIPYAGSRHAQRTEILLGSGSTMFWWEILAPGRHAMGETFAFDRLRLEMRIRTAERPLLIENFGLEPRARPLESVARLGRYTHMANFYAIQTGRSPSACQTGRSPSACQTGRSPSSWRDLEDLLNEFMGTTMSDEGRRSSSIWGASALAADGVVVRGLSLTARDVPATLAGMWSIARRFLTGEDATPPRKIR